MPKPRNTLRLFLGGAAVALTLSSAGLRDPFAIPARAQQSQSTDPKQVVGKFHDTLLQAMGKEGKAAFDERYAMLDPVIRQTFDLAYLSRAVLGPYWQKLSPEQRQTFTERFARNTVATYAARFNGYSGEKFAFAGEQTPQPNLRVVETELTTGEGEKHRFSYLLRQTGQKWQAVNVLVDRVSHIAVQRAEYAAVIRDKGFDGLIAQLDSKTKQMRESS